MNDFDYEAYERKCEEIRECNEGYLVEFEETLVAAGLSDKTIKRHISNVDFYINTYLLREDAQEMPRGCYTTDDFLGYFFIRKCMWSTPSTIKQNAASFKKFYKCMLAHGHIEQADYDALLADIKEGMPLWLADCEEFNDPGDSLFADDAEQMLFDSIRQSLFSMLGYEELLGTGGSSGSAVEKAIAPDANAQLSHEEAVAYLTLALFYLTSWDERIGGKGSPAVHRTWKSADWDALDFLREEGLVDCSNKAKSAYITEEGMAKAREMLAAFGLSHLA